MNIKLNDKETKRNLNKIAGKFAFQIHRELVNDIPRRFRNRMTVNQKGQVWEIGTNDQIFRFWEHPTKPHDIKPKFKKALRFQWANGPPSLPTDMEGYHLFKKVRHPGTEGHKVIEKLAKDKQRLKRLLNKALS